MYNIDERETHITTSDVDDGWTIFTRQSKIIKTLIKNGYEPFNVELEDGKIISCEFHLNLNKITFKKAITKTRQWTDEERQQAKKRLEESRKNK